MNTFLKKKNIPKKIEPFALYTTQNNWVLIAFCCLKNEFRAFRLDCIQRIIKLNTVFTPHEMTFQQYMEECHKKRRSTPDIPLTLSVTNFDANQKKETMKKVKITPFKIIGISVKTTNENSQAAKDIPALWDRFVKENFINRIPNKINDTVYAVYTNYQSDHTKPYTTLLGCKVAHLDVIPNGMEGMFIEGGNYKQIVAKGDLTQNLVINEWIKIWQSDLNRAYSVDFEVYNEKSKDTKNAEVSIYVAIK
ncbi:effector binding domain-containing protein [Aquimarina agarivorans]|uniref:effector binding domain-containing protein n=1 Tax=Aquimarina agarivorans TaxID=980584 RepID=UPI000248EA47|nr:effector binding domain-containing protein [Aquimarina agarivorans]